MNHLQLIKLKIFKCEFYYRSDLIFHITVVDGGDRERKKKRLFTLLKINDVYRKINLKIIKSNKRKLIKLNLNSNCE